MTRARTVLLGYLVLLVLSNGFRLLSPADHTPEPDQLLFHTAALGAADSPANTIRLAYRDLGPKEAPAIVLIHGTPVASRAIMPLAQQLSSQFRVIVPDLPGFGGSSRRVPDYAFRTHATYVDALLNELELKAVHVMGFSQGGGVALSLVDSSPQRIRSLTMLAAIGVQELELLGDYHLNRALYLLQFGALQAVEWFVPHFGYLDTALLSTAFARNVLDSDQRPLRRILDHYAGPMMIIHGSEDRLVPLAAAEEHRRVVPQSDLVVVTGGHMIVLSHTEKLTQALTAFVWRAESGEATDRDRASTERKANATSAFDRGDFSAYTGLTLFVVLLLIALATLVSEDLACIAAGLMVAHGSLTFVPATAACMIGIYGGDLLLFLAGKFLGPFALSTPPLKWFVSDAQVVRSRTWFEQRGPMVVFASRFIPGTRLPTYFVAGMLRMSLVRFSAYFLLAALIWTPLLVGAACLLGTGTFEMFRHYQHYSLLIATVLAIALWIALRKIVPLLSDRGRDEKRRRKTDSGRS